MAWVKIAGNKTVTSNLMLVLFLVKIYSNILVKTIVNSILKIFANMVVGQSFARCEFAQLL